MKKVVVASLVGISLLFAGAPSKTKRLNRRNFISVLKMVKLTDAQIKKIKEIKKSIKRAKTKNALAVAIQNGKFDKNAYIKTRKENMDILIEKRAEFIEKVFNILTPEQKKEIENIVHNKK